MKNRLKKKLKAKKILGNNGRSFDEPKSKTSAMSKQQHQQQKLADMNGKREERRQTISELERISNELKAKMAKYLDQDTASI